MCIKSILTLWWRWRSSSARKSSMCVCIYICSISTYMLIDVGNCAYVRVFAVDEISLCIVYIMWHSCCLLLFWILLSFQLLLSLKFSLVAELELDTYCVLIDCLIGPLIYLWIIFTDTNFQDPISNMYVAEFLKLSDFMVRENCSERIKGLSLSMNPSIRFSAQFSEFTDPPTTTAIQKLRWAIKCLRDATTKG